MTSTLNVLQQGNRYVFSGVLMAANSAPLNGIYQTAMMLINDDNHKVKRKHLVHIVHGRGHIGLVSSQALHKAVQAGMSYWGSATWHKHGDLYHHWGGDVKLFADITRPIAAMPHTLEMAS
jgi:hypothetical protein